MFVLKWDGKAGEDESAERTERHPVYYVILEYLLPVAVHLLLFRADLRCILQSIGTLLLVFLLGSGLKVRLCKSGEAYECRMILPCDAHQLHGYGGVVGSSNWL
ncbi:uncharacterized protein LOC131255172 [Magnolia sinica]|uniref:uncharacterized protein LOC131255172 n=1 Tax=Magnolia sinica TaxID=86752 RepID=UPI002659E28F|nr:uncharacterized protein LOC131255172 [Magnolia sinica]